MASLLNNASLLLNPAGSIISYQEDKIYSVLPKDGTGDFTFTGGDGGTRVNQQGYVEVTPANLNTSSEKFGGGYWFSFGGTVTDDTVAAPNGTITGTTFNGSPAGAYKTFGGIVPGQVYTVSAYVKLGTATNCVFIVNNSIAWNTVGGQSFTSANGLNTTDWTRISYTFTGPSNGQINWHIGQHFETAVTQQTNGTYFVWGAQLNIGLTALPYQPTTDRLNYPRITYQNGRGALMGELQRTNYVLSSNSCNWGGYLGSTLTLSSSISPDGTQNATLLTVSTTQYSGIYYQVNRGTEVPVVSIFAKAGTLPFIYFVNPAGNALVAWYDLRNGTVSNVTAGYNAYMEPYKDGWYRCVLGCPSQTNNYIQIGATDVSGVGAASYAGNIYIWGGQNEVGEFPSTYIPTTSATVTRPADSTSNTSATSVIGQTEGVIYSDLYFEPNGVERNYIYLNDSTGYYNGFCYLVGTATNRLALDLYNSPYTAQFSALSPVLTSGRYKAAIAYKQNDFAFYLNGVQISTDNNGTVPTLDRVYIGQGSDLGYTQGAPVFTTALFNTRLTNAELATLTTVRSGSGGNITYYGPYTIHSFTGSATFTPSFTGPVEVLIAAGGGGGGYDNGGGGGAGGLLYASSYGVAQGTGITVTIGAGGVGGPNGSTKGTNGGNSVFGGLTALGGGGGGSDVNRVGLNGGSGGGTARAEGGSASGLGTPGQGNNGGSAPTSPSTVNGGGGGGAGQVGETSTVANRGGNGGNGLVYSINGFSTYYAGGGGGGSASGESRTNGGLGGGGFGSTGNVYNPTGGTDYLGGGGGGGPGSTSPRDGKNGGIGIVIVRYLT